MRREKRIRTSVLLFLVGVVALMGVGYAAFSTSLTIKGTGTVVGKWDIEITGVEELDPIGHAESASTPTYSALTANMEANLYDKGAAMEYEVTIENKGNIDATLDEIQQSEITNDAIKISVTGYTKGEVLAKKSSKKVKVKIEYDENYDGEAEDGTSASLEVTFVFGQAETTTPVSGGSPTTVNKYKLTFDCKTNGSSSCSNNDEYYKEGDEVDLTSKLPTEPKGYTFKGWGLTSNATTYITSYTVTDSDTTIYAIYEGKEGPSITNVATTSTTNSITAVVTATDSNSTIKSYEYSKDGGDNWVTSDDSTYTFNNLKQNTEYEIYVRVTNEDEGTTYSDKTKVKTKTIDVPLITLKTTQGSLDVSIQITYPEVTKDDGTKLTCQSGLTCSYSKNGLEFKETTNTTEEMTFTEYGTLIAKVTDGTNVSTSSYTADIITSSGIMKLWEKGATTDFHNSTYKTNILTVTVVDTNVVPEEAKESWDVSVAENGSVKAWVLDSETTGKYDLYIGGNGGVKANPNSSYLFNGFSSVTSVNLSLLDTSNVTNMEGIFNGMSNLTTLDLSNFDTSKVSNMNSMFYGCRKLTSLDLNSFDTSNVTNMSYMFRDCVGLTTLDLSNFNTSKVTDMSNMFRNCAGLTTLDLSNFNTSKVTNMESMFAGWDSNSNEVKMALTSIKLSSFDTSKVVDMNHMFFNCGNLTELDLSGFNTINVTNMSSMFNMPNDKTSVLTTIRGLETFDTSKVTDMSYMFSEVVVLTSLDLTNFDTSNVTNMSSMFNGMTNLQTIYASDDFITNNVTTSAHMFENDTNLIGGNGTTYDSEKIDKEYAKTDTSVTKGYFTDKTLPIIDNVSTTSTTNSIAIVTTAHTSESYTITKVEYSNDGGSTYSEGALEGNNPYISTYMFTGLKNNTSYLVKIRVTSSSGKTALVTFDKVVTADELKDSMITSGDGLYHDTIETDRYIYKGANPDNYIEFNNGEIWRIYSIENDGSIKIVKDEGLNSITFDPGYSTSAIAGVKNSSTTAVGTRYSTTSTDFCYHNSGNTATYFGCNAWGSRTTTLDSSGNNVTTQSRTAGGTTYTLPESEAYLNVYLNHQFNNATYKGWVSGTTYEEKTLPSYYSINIDETGYIKSGIWNIGSPGYSNSASGLSTLIDYEKYYKWNGKVGLLTASEYLRANNNTSSCNTLSKLYDNYTTCKATNYLFKSTYSEWLLSPINTTAYGIFETLSNGRLSSADTRSTLKVRPVIYLMPGLELSGKGTQSEPYKISNSSAKTKKINTPMYSDEWKDNELDVTITFNNDCSKFICEYSSDNGSTWNASTSDITTIQLTEYGTYNVIGRVSDGTNIITASTYTEEYVKTLKASGLKALANSDTTTMNKADTARNVRYMGASPKNYITFNEEYDGKAGWRIIGIFGNNIKIIKNTTLTETKWATNKDSNWAKASLMTYLNNGNYWTKSLSDIAKTQIQEMTWYLGTNSTSTVKTADAYKFERGTTVPSSSWPTTWTGNIALMYPSDYGYASSSCYTTRTLNLYNNCTSSNWLFLNTGKYDWLLSPAYGSLEKAFYISYSGDVQINYVGSYSYGVRPTLYLCSDIRLKGEGTTTNPYQIIGSCSS